jgi:hypothetical protein
MFQLVLRFAAYFDESHDLWPLPDPSQLHQIGNNFLLFYLCYKSISYTFLVFRGVQQLFFDQTESKSQKLNESYERQWMSSFVVHTRKEYMFTQSKLCNSN